MNRPLPSFLPVVEEPICVLKIELDGEHIEEIKVFENVRLHWLDQVSV